MNLNEMPFAQEESRRGYVDKNVCEQYYAGNEDYKFAYFGSDDA